ncbi:SDR family oxidoreductase [Algoriphagus confluentis]|uniref:Oxidoreductase n=1 Tax=Algoriphagus confluentis TaxID=1697556 RepID=A0ABQ6PQE7_9BACT|nr:oxidoreductase [Algoriphagus confluentis]
MKKILITGCSTGFGFEAAEYLAEKGHHIYATMRNVHTSNAAAAKALSDFAEAKNLTLEVIELDVTSDESVTKAMKNIPSVDVLINNAGRGFGGAIETFSLEECRAQFDLNVLGNIRMIKAVLPGMRAQKSGLIIQLSSIAGRLAVPGFGIYCASKWAVEAMSESLRYEVGPLGIDVAIVQPGPFSTKFLPNVIIGNEDEVTKAYPHIQAFNEGFVANSEAAFANQDAPTDPMIVVKIFEDLIDAPAGQRPLRTEAGLDFGVKAINESLEPHRITTMNMFQITDWDGAKVS